MKTKLKLFQAPLFCAAALGIVSSFSLAAVALGSPDTGETSATIPWSQIGAKVGATFSDANWISMNPRIPGAIGMDTAAVLDVSGNLYIGGYFTVVGDVIANYIAKWDGTSWTALGSGMGGGDGFNPPL